MKETGVALGVVLLGVAYPRLMSVGSLPATDEGVFAYFGQIIHASIAAGKGLPDTGTLMLYPTLSAWTFALPVNHLIALRLVDLAVALVAGWLFYFVMERESHSRLGGAVTSGIFLFTMNLPVFVQAGFKNSIFAAYVPLFLAVYLAQRESVNKCGQWWLIGMLAAGGVLLRETFMPFLLVGVIATAFGWGWRAAVRFASGAALFGIIATACILLARGSVAGLVDAYRDAGMLYAAIADQRTSLLVNNGTVALREAMFAVALSGLAAATILVGCLRGDVPRRALRRFAFWAALAFVPLFEPVAKIGFPYHFAVSLPGLAGMCALAWRCIASSDSRRCYVSVASSIIVAAVVCLYPRFAGMTQSWSATMTTLRALQSGAWPSSFVSQSNYLIAAEAIRATAPRTATLSVSGFMLTLFPLTGLLPPDYSMAHLNATLMKLGGDEKRFALALAACPPDVLLTTTRMDWPGAAVIEKVVKDSGMYREVATIPIASEKSYGTFGGTVYKYQGTRGERARCQPAGAA